MSIPFLFSSDASLCFAEKCTAEITRIVDTSRFLPSIDKTLMTQIGNQSHSTVCVCKEWGQTLAGASFFHFIGRFSLVAVTVSVNIYAETIIRSVSGWKTNDFICAFSNSIAIRIDVCIQLPFNAILQY